MQKAAIALSTLILSTAAAWAAGPTPVLDTSGFWRVHYTLRTPVVVDADGKTHALKNPCETPLPPAGWQAPDFDDASWDRICGPPLPAVRSSWHPLFTWDVGSVYLADSTDALGLLALRGKFRVSDPAKVAGLKLDLAYRGGAVVYLNGVEVARGSLPAGKLTPQTLAERYPDDVYRDADGRLLGGSHTRAEALEKRYRGRNRSLSVDVPSSALRKGVNVLAIEIHRAPQPAFLAELFKQKNTSRADAVLFDHCGLQHVSLRADDARGLVPDVTRPKGVQVWNVDVVQPVFDLDYGDPCETLRPVRIVGTRGGVFSGQVVLGSDEPIRGLKATVSDLAGANAKVPASVVQVRFALPDGYESGIAAHYAAAVSRFDGLDDQAPAEVRVRKKNVIRDSLALPAGVTPPAGAVQPVWLTVSIPRDASPGEYTGTLTLSMEGHDPIEVPVRLKVDAWRMPAPRDFRTFVELIPSPDSLAMQYNVPTWSDAHFALVGQTFEQLAKVGNRTVYVPLINHTNLGNAQTMVRWVKKDGGYTWDFSVMDRYLDLYAKHCGKPEAVVLGVWDTFLEGGSLRYARTGRYAADEVWEAFDKAKGLGPRVTMLGADGKPEVLQLPLYTDTDKSLPLWKPLCARLMEHLKKRGWAERATLGFPNDTVPTKEVVAFFDKVLPGVDWIRQAHSDHGALYGKPYRLQMLVWSPRFLVYPHDESMHGWQRPMVQFPRNFRNGYPLTSWRLLAEMNVMGGQRGFGRLGADYWPVVEDKRGRKTGLVAERFPETRWRNLTIATSLLAPGAKGPLGTVRLEMIREGVEASEARIFIEDALLDKTKRVKLGAPLASRAETVLKERARDICQALHDHHTCGWQAPNVHGWWNNPGRFGTQWYPTSGWQQRSDALYALAGEVQQKLEE